MFRVLSCLGGQHDLRLVALAGLVCVITSLVTINLVQRAYSCKDNTRWFWSAAAGVAGGCGTWSTHFVGMLAYQPGVPVGFDVLLTVLSLVVASVLMAAGSAIAVSFQRKIGISFGGIAIGLGIAAMHYLGMSALEVPGELTWSADIVVASILIGIVFAVIAMQLARIASGVGVTLAASVALVVAIVGHHFTAMGAIVVHADPRIVVTPTAIDPTLLALFIAATSGVVLAIGAFGLIIDRRIGLKNDQLAAALHNMHQGLCMLNKDFEVVVVNDRFLEMFGIASNRIAPRMQMRTLMDIAEESIPFVADSRPAIRCWAREMAAGQRSGKTIFTRTDGRIFSITVDSMPSAEGWVETFEDITERREAEDKIAHMARHDSLTDLPNRVHFRERLASSLETLARDNTIAVLCLDLDRFKVVNDTLGHQCGDQLLKVAAERLRGALRETDFIARIGGDEFCVLQMAKEQPMSATGLARRLVEVMSAPVPIGDHQMQVGVSVGISIAPNDSCDAEQLLKDADLALYRAKAEGRGTYRFFEQQMDARMQARRALELDLRHAVSTCAFELHYQPFVDLETNEVNGCEALLRWNDPVRGKVPPLDFISVAEETGLIIPIGEWVLREACMQASRWPDHVRIAVNLSPVQFKNNDLVHTVADALAISGLAPHRLELEITESVLLNDNATTLSTLHQLRAMGVSIAMDDFGTGYSSLSYLRKFPFDKIKIDQSFIRELADGGDSLAIVRAVTGLGSSLGISTVAEGVETEEQLARLKAEGCNAVQGFYLGVPKPAPDVDAYFDKTAALRAVA